MSLKEQEELSTFSEDFLKSIEGSFEAIRQLLNGFGGG